jgi:DNA-binding LacI/PurR family transcriptional regulator/signal transduction histidine kinase
VELNTAPIRDETAALTLGFFMAQLGKYEEAVWKGVVQVAREYNANVLSFVGSALNWQLSYRKYWNVLYDLASPVSLDGLIVLSASLMNFLTAEEIAQFRARYTSLPIISVGQELEGTPSITIDNVSGLSEIIAHLIEHHQRRQIAFICGPEHNPEAMRRYHVYVKVLEDHGIPVDPDLVTPGNFNVNGGIEAVKQLLDRRKVSFDAVVASNDNMAIGVWSELTRRGFNLPADIAVTGFDDVPEARVFATPLTTVHQPLVEQGQQAARMLLEYLCHGKTQESLYLETMPVIRESCGCSPLAGPKIEARGYRGVSKEVSIQERDAITAAVQAVICAYFSDIPAKAIEPMVDAFFDTLQGGASSPFLTLFKDLLMTGMMSLDRAELDEGGIGKWQEALSILSEAAVLHNQIGVVTDVDELLYQGHALITEAAERAHANLRIQTETSNMIQSEIVRSINTVSSLEQIADILADGLPRLNIRTCFLALYEGEPVPPPLSRLIMACHNDERLELGQPGRLFPSAQLIPHDILPESEWPLLIVRPLMSGDTHFGFVLMEMTTGYRAMSDTYEILSEQIGLALYRTLLQQQIERSNKELQQHAAELAEANTQLEQFAYAASHDLQEPLRMITSYLQLLEKRYQAVLDSDAKEFVAYAVDGAMRMKRMIDDLLAYSRISTQGQSFSPVSCEGLLAQAITNLEIAIQEHKAVITHDPLPVVNADAMQLLGVFQNLVGNAIKFHADKPPQIHIQAEEGETEWVFSVRDNGIGIPPDCQDRIFSMFGRLHTQAEYPGSGIGLAICKKVVERHGGRIWFESQPGHRTTFFFTIPV